MATNVTMPQLGESVVEGTVSRWLKQEGDTIEAFEPIVEISTDKVETEIPAETGGILLKIYVGEGETVERGALLAVIGQQGEALPSTGTTAPHTAPMNGHTEPINAPAPTPTPTTYTGHMTPVVARMAAEHQLDLAQIQGTGRGGRVTKKDVESYLENNGEAEDDIPPWERPIEGADLFKPTVEYGMDEEPVTKTPAPIAKSAPQSPQAAPPQPRVHPVEAIPEGSDGELVALTPMRKAIAEHMVFSKRTSPHVTTVFEIDLTAVLKHRQAHKDMAAKQGINLTLTAYFVMATVEGLRVVPTLNARWTDDGIYLINRYDIGMAVAIDNGLIVPVIKNAGDLNLLGTARAVNDLATRARNKQLKPDEVQGGTFSITNHGVSGSLFATPIINQPQVGILGLGLMEKRVKVIDDMIAVRPCIYASLTFDHRVVDGAGGDAFLLTLKKRLEAWT